LHLAGLIVFRRYSLPCARKMQLDRQRQAAAGSGSASATPGHINASNNYNQGL
jgi:hypothetical protein